MTRAARPVPEGYTTITPYLITSDLPRLLAFLERAFGGKVLHTTRTEGVVRHAEVRVGTAMLMAGQGSEAYPPRPAMYYLYVEDCDAVHAKAVAAGATSIGVPADQPYGDRNGAVEDFDGNQWYIGTRIEDLSEAEVEERMAAKG